MSEASVSQLSLESRVAVTACAIAMAADWPAPVGLAVPMVEPFEFLLASIDFLMVSVIATCSARASAGEVKLNT